MPLKIFEAQAEIGLASVPGTGITRRRGIGLDHKGYVEIGIVEIDVGHAAFGRDRQIEIGVHRILEFAEFIGLIYREARTALVEILHSQSALVDSDLGGARLVGQPIPFVGREIVFLSDLHLVGCVRRFLRNSRRGERGNGRKQQCGRQRGAHDKF